MAVTLSLIALGLFCLFFFVVPSIRVIGPTQIGLVMKRFAFKKLPEDNPVAFQGEAGYQADLLMPGWRWKFWIVYKVEKHPWVQVPAGEIGVVVAQVGKPLPVGAKSAIFKKEFTNFSSIRAFVDNGGQKGVQRPVLPPGSLAPIHPVGFLVLTRDMVYGVPVAQGYQKKEALTADDFGLDPEQLQVTRVEARPTEGGRIVDMMGIVTTFEGDPLPPGAIASRLGAFEDIEKMLAKKETKDSDLQEVIMGTKNQFHNNYQDFQAFLDNGGKIGLQHDVLLYGAFNLNPFLVKVDLVPMLVVEQGEVAVIKAYVGLPAEDTSGPTFKFGSLVRPGHKGIWQDALRTGKYPINPHCYMAEIVPTAILTLNWADAVSTAHKLDAQLKPIDAKSREGFIFHIDLQVQIHVADTEAPKVIAMVGTMQNLVTEVLQAAVGNHFRDKLQSMPAVTFIETRQQVQEQAFQHIQGKLGQYSVETRGVYIQDVILPPQLVEVLTSREIAHQQIETFQRQREAQDMRVTTEKAKGTADMQADLAKAKVGVSIADNQAKARKRIADGDATYVRETGKAKGDAYKFQAEALGQDGAAAVNIISSLAEKELKFVPEVLVEGGDGAGKGVGSIAALAGAFTKKIVKGETAKKDKLEKKDKRE